MSNDYIFFILTILLYLLIFEILKKAHMKHLNTEKEEQRSGNDRRQLFMYRIPERRGLLGQGESTGRRGGEKATARKKERRSGKDRRQGIVRRKNLMFKIPERRLIANRRDGIDRRKTDTSPDPVVA